MFQLASYGITIPLLKENHSLSIGFTLIHGTKSFLKPPRSCRFYLAVFQRLEPLFPFFRKVFKTIQPHKPCSLKLFSLSKRKQYDFLSPYRINCGVHILNNVEWIMSDYIFAPRHVSNYRVHIGLPHIHADAVNLLKLGSGLLLPIRVKRRFVTAIRNMIYKCGIIGHLGNYRNIVVTLTDTLLVKTNGFCRNVVFTLQASINPSAFDAINFIPRKTKIAADGFNAAIVQHIDGKAFKKCSKPAMLLCPRNTNRYRPVRGALNPWYSCLNNSPKLAGI